LKSLEEKEKDVKERMEMERKDWNAQMEKVSSYSVDIF